MKVASSQLNFSGGHTLRIRQEQNSLSQRSTLRSSTDSSATLPISRRVQSTQGSLREQVSLNSHHRYQTNNQSYVTNSNNEDDNALFTSEKLIESTLSKTFTQNIRVNVSQLTLLEPPAGVDPSAENAVNNVTQAQIAVGEQNIYEEEERTHFSIKGKVTAEDGKTISFTLSAQLERNFAIEKRERILAQNTQMTDPLAINLDGGIVTLRDTAFQFDLDSDGEKEDISFVSKGNGFIVYDKNDDGEINDGNEMFGTQSGNGFQDLSQYDEDDNGVIDENDAIYDKLAIWTKDGAGNDHLTSLRDTGIGAIGLEYDDTQFELKDHYNNSLGSIQRSGYFLMESGEAGFAQQVDLSKRNLDMEQDIKQQFEATIASVTPFEFSAPELAISNFTNIGNLQASQTDPVLTLEQATVLTKQANDELIANYDKVSAIEQTEETKSLLEQLVEKLEQYGAEQKDKQDKEDNEV